MPNPHLKPHEAPDCPCSLCERWKDANLPKTACGESWYHTLAQPCPHGYTSACPTVNPGRTGTVPGS
jgi:hypothetical protein